ncbi:GTP cyclohydrolase II [Kamptonema cortianum]|uniref:GTP cyclohydrolase II n=1 Tax=Geitlerinema calcuttense NRMC-F 0142 TaxID=2922238 RepID=A0ABT7LYR4_9CYAN|nr:GTP cyclohydrolase II [Geitlerinema calcuttense]MDK3155115.1 GTP cyclohydrolase II [Kamptonema cortianum]MDL5057133.1 GTP cyclohydrolase II [Geitlerinema calcuttense NRMC-F 0142]
MLEKPSRSKHKHIVLTSHPRNVGSKAVAIHWGECDPLKRGPIVATVTTPAHRNVIGTHSGSYAIYRALAVARKTLQADHRADLTNTSPVEQIGPHPSWFDPDKIISLDPFGAMVGEVYTSFYEQGYDIRPTIAITKAHINMPELLDAVAKGRLQIDGKIMKAGGDLVVTKAAIEPVWYLPGIAKRLGIAESELRHALFEQTGGMFPELVTRPDLSLFLPPIGGVTVYILGEIAAITDPNSPVAVRVHDECNGSDVFGSDICTCRPYLVHGIEECIRTAQQGGVGIIVYFRKEGRALGEVTKFLVYNARKRQEGGDRAAAYFERTECVAGVQDMRFQEFMPDVLHWLGVTQIDRLVSMSNLKYNAIVNSGIKVIERVPIPPELIPADAQVEIEAKKAAGYYTDGDVPDEIALTQVIGRGLSD